MRVRVQGASRIEATAVATGRGAELSGLVTDEAGRPVADARVRVRLITPSGAPRSLPGSRACAAAAGSGARSSDGAHEALAETDAKGRFCLRWWDELPNGRLSLLFEDEKRLLEPSALYVAVDRRSPIDLAFAPAPRTLSLDDGTITLVVQSRTRFGEAPERAPVVVSLLRNGGAVELAKGVLRPAEAVRLSFQASLLGAPGPGELVAKLELGELKAEVRAPVLVTARVELQVPAEVSTDSSGEGQLRVTALTALGTPVSTGSVEAQSAGRTIGIATLEDGIADVRLALGAQSGTFPVTIRYLPSTPWWTPTPERMISVKVPKASLWQRLPWAMGWLVVAVWILLAWKRPGRRDAGGARPDPVTVVEPAVEWVASDAASDLWSGQVTDAHDGVGVPGARVIVALSNGEPRIATSDAHGHFEMFGAGLAKDGRIRVEAPLHASLERPLPPPGRLAITLVTRRRALLARLVAWARRMGSAPTSDREPTPGELALAASRAERGDVAAWATAVEAAAFGAEAVGAEREASVLALEPSDEDTHHPLDRSPEPPLPNKP